MVPYQHSQDFEHFASAVEGTFKDYSTSNHEKIWNYICDAIGALGKRKKQSPDWFKVRIIQHKATIAAIFQTSDKTQDIWQYTDVWL